MVHEQTVPNEYVIMLAKQYRVFIFGDFGEEIDNYDWIDYAVFVIFTIVTMIVLTNVLIAYMGDTFERV